MCRMGKRRITALLACALAAASVSGCAGNSRKTAGDKRYVVVCEDHAVTGSHVARPGCYRRLRHDVSQADDRRDADRENVRRMQLKGTAPQQPAQSPPPR